MTSSIIQLVHRNQRERLRHSTTGRGTSNDRELLKRFSKQHDEDAFEELVRRYGSLVLSVAKRIVKEHQAAEDVLQATFFVLARKANSVAWKATIAPWLYATAYRLACNARKRQRITASLKDEPPDRSSQAVVWDETCLLLDEELMKLAEPSRAALILCYLEGKTRDEAAQLLGLSLATLKRRLEQGRHLLRDRLTRRGIAFSAAGWGLILSKSELNAGAVQTVMQAALAKSLPASAALLLHSGLPMMLPSVMLMMLSLCAAGSWWWLVQPVLAVTQVSTSAVVQSVVQKEGPPVDVYGDPLPEGALARLGTIRFRPGQMISDIAFSHDRRYLAGWMRGYMIAQGNDRLVYWDAATGQEVRSLDLPKNNLLTMRWLPDGRLLALTRFAHRYYHLCEFASGKETTFPEADSNSLNSSSRGDIRSAAISPDGKWIATGRRSAQGEHQPIELWEARPNASLDDQQPIQLGVYPGHCLYLQFSDDGKRLVALCRSQGAMINVPSEKPVIGQPAGSLIDGAWEENATVMIIDLASRKQLYSFKVAPPQGFFEMFPPPQRMALTRNGSTLYVGDETGKVHGYDCQTGKETMALQIYQKTDILMPYEHSFVASVAISRDGHTLYACPDKGGLQEWDLDKKQKRRTMTDLDRVSHLTLSSDGKRLAIGNPTIIAELAIYDTAPGQRQNGLPGHQYSVNSLTLLPNDQLMTTATDRQLIWWDLKTNKEVKRQTCPLLAGYKGMLSYTEEVKGQFGYLPDRRNLAFCDLEGQTTICTSNFKEDDFIHYFSCANTGMFYTNRAGLLHFWDAKSKSLKTYPHTLDDVANSLRIESTSISPDQSTVVLFSDGLLKGDDRIPYRCQFLEILDAGTGKQRKYWLLPAHSRCSAFFSPDGKNILVTGNTMGTQFTAKTPAPSTLPMPTDQAAALFDPQSGRLISSFEKPNKQSWMPSTALFTQDGQHVVIAWVDASIGYYETATGKLLRTYTSHRGTISTMHFLPGEQRLISASDDGTCLIWDVSPKALSEGNEKKGKE